MGQSNMRTRYITHELDDVTYVAEYTDTPITRTPWYEPDDGGLTIEAVYVDLPALCGDTIRVPIVEYQQLQVYDELYRMAETEVAADRADWADYERELRRDRELENT